LAEKKDSFVNLEIILMFFYSPFWGQPLVSFLANFQFGETSNLNFRWFHKAMLSFSQCIQSAPYSSESSSTRNNNFSDLKHSITMFYA
jgi:hypothetical protein